MRKQYHFWRGDHGLDAWDVDRLIRLSGDLPATELDLDSIAEIDTAYWYDEGFERPTVRALVDHVRLIHHADLSYPIILAPDHRVMDGMHRVARALLEERRTILAVRFEVLPEPDFRDCRAEDLPY